MQPNNPQVPQQNNQPQALPPQPQQPAPNQFQQQPVQGYNQAPPPSSKSKTGLIIGLIVGAVVLILGIIIVSYLLFFSDSAVSKRQSAAFMNAMTTGNIDEALKYSQDTSPKSKIFLTGMKNGMQGSYSLKETANDSSKRYFLYSLNGAKSQAARTELQKQDGKWVVSGLVTGGPNLAVKAQSGSTDAEDQPASSSSPSACLVQSDFDVWYKAAYGKTATESGFNFQKPDNMFTTNVKFKADSVEYDNPQVFNNMLSNVADLAKSVSGKEFTIRLEGSVATTSAADLDFATQRAEKIKAELVKLGVPASKISVEKPINIDAISEPARRDEVTKQAARGVNIKFDPTCSSSTNSDGR